MNKKTKLMVNTIEGFRMSPLQIGFGERKEVI